MPDCETAGGEFYPDPSHKVHFISVWDRVRIEQVKVEKLCSDSKGVLSCLSTLLGHHPLTDKMQYSKKLEHFKQAPVKCYMRDRADVNHIHTVIFQCLCVKTTLLNPLTIFLAFFFFIVLHAQTAILSANLSIQARKDNLNLHLQINMQINSYK